MKFNVILPSILAAGLLTGGVMLTGASKAEPTKSGGEVASVAQASAMALPSNKISELIMIDPVAVKPRRPKHRLAR